VERSPLMLEKLREALSATAGSLRKRLEEVVVYRDLTEKDLDEPLEDLVFSLAEADVALEVAERIASSTKKALVGSRVRRGEDVELVVRKALYESIVRLLSTPGRVDVRSLALERCGSQRPLVIVFFGINGVGKTTTIAKIAYMLKREGARPVVAAADTFRAGAQEQLRAHADRLGVPFIGGKYGRDPASVALDAINYASSRGMCSVLVDTAGRMHIDADLMEELRKIVRVSRPDLRLLVVDALTGNDAVEQAVRFNEAIGIDGVIVTKIDADAKGGTVVSIAATIGKPILYLGTGQSYEDLEEFDPQKFVSRILPLKARA